MNTEASSLSDQMTLKREQRLRTAPETFRGILRAAMSGKCSPRAAIKAQCAECIGFDRDAIRTCTAYACPLWNFRPYRQ